VFAGVVLQAPGVAMAWRCLLVAVPLLADALICVLRRLMAGQPVFQAHRLHLYQRLQQAGWSHRRCAVYLVHRADRCALLAGGGVAGSAAAAVVLAWGVALDRTAGGCRFHGGSAGGSVMEMAAEAGSWLSFCSKSSGSSQDAPDALGHRLVRREALAQQGQRSPGRPAVERLRGFWAEGIQHLHPCGMKWRTLRVHHCNPVLQCRGCDHQVSAVMADLR